MSIQNIKRNSKIKKVVRSKAGVSGMKKKKKEKNIGEEKSINFNLLLILTFFTGVILIFSSYAWFYATLNVKIDFFKMVVSNHTGLFISLDGREFSSAVTISKDVLITDMENTYPNNINQWASAGLFAVSSNGIKNADTYKFDMYAGFGKGKSNEKMEEEVQGQVDACINTCDGQCSNKGSQADQIECFNQCVSKCEEIKNYYGSRVGLSTRLVSETRPNASNIFIAFDFFLKNVSGSPKSDNLYFDKGTSVKYNDDVHDNEDGIIDSLRIGLVKVGSVPLKSDVNTMQNITCNGKCEMIIYEPNSTSHSESSIKRATKHHITLVDGVYTPTYAVIGEGDNLELANGQAGSGFPLDTVHFAEQKTMTDADFAKPIFAMPNAITKMRAYVWIEGQDIDSLETKSNGGAFNIVINLIKDLAGYY